MGNQYPMWVKCNIQLRVEQQGKVFRTLEECPNGCPPGLEINHLWDQYCIGCPKNTDTIPKPKKVKIRTGKKSKQAVSKSEISKKVRMKPGKQFKKG